MICIEVNRMGRELEPSCLVDGYNVSVSVIEEQENVGPPPRLLHAQIYHVIIMQHQISVDPLTTLTEHH